VARVAVFGGPSLKRRLKGLRGALEYAFFPLPGPASPGPQSPGPAGARGPFDGALIEVGRGVGPETVRAVRRAVPGRPVGIFCHRPNASQVRSADRLGLVGACQWLESY